MEQELVNRMMAAKAACDAKCTTCGVGIGKWCEHRVVDMTVTYLSPFVRRALTGALPAKEYGR